jgi:acyl dehydratase
LPVAGSESGQDRRIGPFDTRIDDEFVHGYAAAVGAPVLAIAARIFEAQLAGIEELVPATVSAASGIHGEHDVFFHRPIVKGEALATYVETYSARPVKDNVRLVLRHATVDSRERPVAEQFWTTLLLGATCEPYGADPPDHSFPEHARERPAATYVVPLDADMPRRYAEVSRDFSAHHFDIEAARRSGFESVFLHGLCTMGLCAQGAVQTVAGGDSGRIKRIAVRFASPAFLGQDLAVQFYEAGSSAFVFEAFCSGTKVISNGRVELVPGGRQRPMPQSHQPS